MITASSVWPSSGFQITPNPDAVKAGWTTLGGFLPPEMSVAMSGLGRRAVPAAGHAGLAMRHAVATGRYA